MKKINAKMTALLFSFVSMVYASDEVSSRPESQSHKNRFMSLPIDVINNIRNYLEPREHLALSNTRRNLRSIEIAYAKKAYAECIVQNTHVPQEIKDILSRITNPNIRLSTTVDIAQYISHKINGGFLHHRKSLPPFLHPYFYQMTPQDLHLVLDQNISDGSIPSQALLHMETCGTYWVDVAKTPADRDTLMLNYAKSSYISFQNALQLPADRAIPKYMIARENEVRDRNNTVPLNSFFALNPNAVLVIDAERSTMIEIFDSSLIQNVKHIAFIGSHLTHIGPAFLIYCFSLTTLDLSPLSNVTSIGYSFLSDCSGLTTLNLSPLSNVTSIGGGFLSGCRGLTTLDLSPLSKVTSIGNRFLYCCGDLTTLDLSPLSNVTSIGDEFLFDCKGLTTLDLSPLSNVTYIGNEFLSGCAGLTMLDLSPLSNVTSIGYDFLSGCNKLQEIFVIEKSYIDRILANRSQFVRLIRYKN